MATLEDQYADMSFTAKDFAVNPPSGNPRLQAYADSIITLEPALRVAGRTMNFELLTALTDSGQLTGLTPDKLADIVKLF